MTAWTAAARAAGLAGLALALGACESTVVGPTTVAPPAGSVRFSIDIQPVFASSCGGGACHVRQSASGVDLSSVAAIRASVGAQYGEPIVRPGDAAASPLVDKLEASPRLGARMPLGWPPLTAPQIAAVRAWIDAGALDT